jgi:hypothetical protein
MKKFILAALFCTSAHAEFMDGNKLLDKMTDGSTINDMMALGYVVGVADTTRGILHCVNSNATAGQLQDMVKKELYAAPENRHHSADSIVVAVLRRQFPCAKRGTGT